MYLNIYIYIYICIYIYIFYIYYIYYNFNLNCFLFKGIATQSVVERMLMKEENKSRHDLGREEFVKRVWDWKQKYGNTIMQQIR